MSYLKPLLKTIDELKAQGSTSTSKLVAFAFKEAFGRLSEDQIAEVCEELKAYQAEEWAVLEKRHEDSQKNK